MKSKEEILDSKFVNGMTNNWKMETRLKILDAMDEYANQFKQKEELPKSIFYRSETKEDMPFTVWMEALKRTGIKHFRFTETTFFCFNSFKPYYDEGLTPFAALNIDLKNND